MARSRSYTSGRLGVRARLVELAALARASRDAGAIVPARLDALGRLEADAVAATGRAWEGLDVLEIGSGPLSIEAIALATRNRVVGIDQNLVPRGLDLRGWLAQLRSNGALRTAKTAGRRALGQDRRIRRALRAALGVERLPTFELRAMDAADLELDDGSVDLVTSRSVFEHLEDPVAVSREARRVLRPGGVLAISLHLYTSDSGCHDARIFAGHRAGLPFWAHLRDEHRHRVIENAYLNRLSLAQWTDLFQRELPGSVVRATRDAARRMAAPLQDLRAAGELAGYSDDELLSEAVHVIWGKPEDPKGSRETVPEP